MQVILRAASLAEKDIYKIYNVLWPVKCQFDFSHQVYCCLLGVCLLPTLESTQV